MWLSCSYVLSVGSLRFFIVQWAENSYLLKSYAGDSLDISNNKLEKDYLPVGKNIANNGTMQQPNNSGSSSNSNLGGNSSNVDPALALKAKANKALEDAQYWYFNLEYAKAARDECLNIKPHPSAPREVQEEWQQMYDSNNFDTSIPELVRNGDSEYRKYVMLQKKKFNGEYTMDESSSQPSSTKRTAEDSPSSSKKRRDN